MGLYVSLDVCRILRRDVDQIGYSRNFTIIDTSEQNTLMKRVLKELNIDPKNMTRVPF